MSSSRPTETAIRNFLRKELEKREVKVESERSYKRAPVGAALEKLRFLIARIRKSRNDQAYYEWFEHLCDEMKMREQKFQQSKA